MKELKIVSKKQVEVFQRTNGDAKLIDKSCGDLIYYLIGENTEKSCGESRDLFRSLQLNEQLYFSHVVRGFASKLLWPEVSKIIKTKGPPCPYSTIAEILYEADNKELAADTFCKVPDKEQRIELLLDYKFWVPAMEEMCKTKLHEDYAANLIGLAKQNGQGWVEAEFVRKLEQYQLR